MAELFNIRNESDTSEWTSLVQTGGTIVQSVGSALASTSGGIELQRPTGSTSLQYLAKSFTALSGKTDFRIRWYWGRNTLTMVNTESHNFLELYSATSATARLRLPILFNTTPKFRLQLSIRNDAGTETSGTLMVIGETWPEFVEIHVQRATNGTGANDGFAKIYFAGSATPEVEITGVDIFDFFDFNEIRIGHATGVDSGTTGTMYLDEVVARDDATVIGAAVSLPDTPIATTNWVATADSEESAAATGLASHVLDTDTSKRWLTEFSVTNPAHPHFLWLDMLASKNITGLLHLPIMKDNISGQINAYKFYYKTDSGSAPTVPISIGEWTQVLSTTFPNTKALHEAVFSQVSSRYVLLESVSTHELENWASVSKLWVLGPHDAGVIEKPIAGIATPDPHATTTIEVGSSLTFTGREFSRHSTISSRLWDFTGTGISNQTALSPGLLQFNTPGEFTITLKVTDAATVESELATVVVKVTAADPVGTIVSPPGDVSIIPGDQVVYEGSSGGGQAPLSHLWEFGAGSGIADTTAEQPGTKQFDNAGDFTTTYTVTDSLGAVDPSPPTVLVSVAGSSHELPVDQVVEADLAFGITQPESVEFEQAVETDAALQINLQESISIGQAQESNSSLVMGFIGRIFSILRRRRK